MASHPHKILVSSVNFAPDHAGIGVYSTDWPVYLAEQGHHVTMVTGFPYYPKWEKQKQDHGVFFRREEFQKVNVLRGYLYVPRKVSTFGRLLHEFSFSFFAALNFLRAGRHDVIILFTPPFFLGMVGVLFKYLWRRPLVINIQDLPLDAAVALGMVKQGVVARAMLALERWIYKQADQVATISTQMLENVAAKKIATDRLLLVPNWIDVESAAQKVSKGFFLNAYPEVTGKFIVAYAGNIGVKQGIDILLRLAKSVENSPQFHFFVIGDGADKPRLEQLLRDQGNRNVTFLPFMPPTEYRRMLADVQAVFVAQRSGAGNNFFPSKLLGLMAQSKALLVAADLDSELAKVIEQSGCGLVAPYGDIKAMKENLTRLSAENYQQIGAAGLQHVKQYDRSHILGKWLREVCIVISGQGECEGELPS